MENLKEERKGFETLGLSYPAHDQVKVEALTLAGVTCYRFTPPDVVSPETVVYTHGGGYIYGSIRSHRAMVSHIAAATGRVIIFVEYSLAPEKPYPHALNEIIAVVRELVRATPAAPFALMGDSVGGNLAMSTALHLQQLRLPRPQYQVLISPWLNMNNDAASYQENEKNDPILTKALMQRFAASYTTPAHFNDPLVSSVFGSYQGFNPTLILVGNREILRDDSLQLDQALKQSGSVSRLEVFAEVTHVWTLTNIDGPDSRQALNMTREFMDEVTAAVKSEVY